MRNGLLRILWKNANYLVLGRGASIGVLLPSRSLDDELSFSEIGLISRFEHFAQEEEGSE